jgi:hypothetical protein
MMHAMRKLSILYAQSIAYKGLETAQNTDY